MLAVDLEMSPGPLNWINQDASTADDVSITSATVLSRSSAGVSYEVHGTADAQLFEVVGPGTLEDRSRLSVHVSF